MPSARDRQARVATYVVYAVQGLSFASLLIQVANLQARHRLDEGSLTMLLLVVPVFAGVGSVAAGTFAARFGSKLLLRIAQPAVAAAVVLAGLAPNVPLLLPVLLLFGVAVGAVDAGMNMQGVAVERRYGVEVLNGFHCVWSVFSLAAALWASAAAGLPLQVVMAVPMVLAVAGSLYAGPGLCTREEEKVEAASTSAAGRFPWRPIIPLCLAMGFLYVGDAAVSNFNTVFMKDVLGAGPAVVPLAYAAYQATTLAVRLGGDFAVRRYGPAAIVRIGGVIATVGFLGVVLAPTQPLGIVAFGLTGVGLSVVAPQSFSAAGRLDPAGTGVAIARVNLFNYVGFIVGAALVGGIADAADMRVAFAAPLVLAAAIIALAPGFEPKRAPATT
ncbi:Membrane protein mosC [[Actinomadura] parvosata subsp. kistnae]|uniref:MFS transporter n=1 Tax=[Actinomadura] parvosata subsp. kistnae TaxID=1909395 RepID=A0A1V0AEY9_9ACTN|nr:MFS transporter [Nonomuraea sp. ATCC 55076]AQZ68768.1 MFS transporter [Nonomuraea sp. ATCC 55076]SPL92725.1 Membrane protein mosC [Actinomadura parvosata subsp. kistnae]